MNRLQPGDMIFLASDPAELTLTENKDCFLATSTSVQCAQVDIPLQVVHQICRRFGLDEIEKTPNHASALRLTLPGAGTSDYCHRLNLFLGIQEPQ
jgi:hypothetical protein